MYIYTGYRIVRCGSLEWNFFRVIFECGKYVMMMSKNNIVSVWFGICGLYFLVGDSGDVVFDGEHMSEMKNGLMWTV